MPWDLKHFTPAELDRLRRFLNDEAKAQAKAKAKAKADENRALANAGR